MLAFVALASIGAEAAESALVPNVGCREGQPNGAYELRMADGRPRVVGAFHDGKRTGTFIFWNESGGRLAAIPYDNNVRNGTVALWHIGGKPPREIGRRLEAPVVHGQAHGAQRGWHVNGKLMYEATYERGRLVAASAWDARGRALPDAEARKLVTDAQRRDDVFLGTLERLVSEHRGQCDEAAKA